MPSVKNIIINGSGELPIVLDLFFPVDAYKKPVVVYAHGFNGFKDWGNFDLAAKQFADAGFPFIKFNFSHNGTSPDGPEEFTNLEAFGNNNYSKQLADLQLLIDWICNADNGYNFLFDTNNISLIGHSMGGGISILYSAIDRRIKKLVTWAAISECKTPWGNWPAEKMQQWKENGVAYYSNSRTNQQMPMYYQLFEDYEQNREKLDIEKAMRQLTIPVLICHGLTDAAVPVDRAYDLKSWKPDAELFINESDHVFGRKHPWTEKELPPAMQEVLDTSIRFLKN